MTIAPRTHLTFFVFALLALPSGCAATSESTEEDFSASRELEGERLTDADQQLTFQAEERADAETPPDRIAWGTTFAFAEDKVGRDFVPAPYDYAGAPIAAIKLLVALPDTVRDWFRAWNYAKWTLPNRSEAPMKVTARLGLYGLNWFWSRGRASLRVCGVKASGEEYDCRDLGSVKKGVKRSERTLATFERPRSTKIKSYYRDYDITVPPGESVNVYVKHKLECTMDDFFTTMNRPDDDKLGCRVEPVTTIRFTK
ncbi:MAG: hypothetical protein U0174_19530 [Polyangiaceae bacterium]